MNYAAAQPRRMAQTVAYFIDSSLSLNWIFHLCVTIMSQSPSSHMCCCKQQPCMLLQMLEYSSSSVTTRVLMQA